MDDPLINRLKEMILETVGGTRLSSLFVRTSALPFMMSCVFRSAVLPSLYSGWHCIKRSSPCLRNRYRLELVLPESKGGHSFSPAAQEYH